MTRGGDGHWVEDADPALPLALRLALRRALEEMGELERRLREVERQIAALAAATPTVVALRTLPGVALLTALVAFVGCCWIEHRWGSTR